MTENYKKYFLSLEVELDKLYEISKTAKLQGLDVSNFPEPEITHDIAERVEMMIGPKGLSQRMRELEQLDRREIAFKIAEEITHGRFGSMDKVKAADQAVRTGLAIMTEGVTIAPIEGIPKIVIKQNPDRSQFLSVYFAGPIRPAGGTAQALTLVLADHVRRLLGLEKWQPSEETVQRFIEEVRVYERNVRRFQYHVTDEDLEFAMRQMPVEPTGVSTDQFEVSNYRDIPSIETNRLRGGALIVVVDGVVGRARKLYGNCEKLGVSGWDWLNRMGKKKLNEDNEEIPTAAFMDEIIVGRPVFSFPGAVGGFRLRYGRARNTGLAAVGVHPATMIILNKFLTTGVQMRTELPGKSAASCPVDGIEPPIVKLKDGSVIRIESEEEAELKLPLIEKILFLGDYLSNAGDFIQNNKPLLPSGYDENQWLFDLDSSYIKYGSEAAIKLTGLLKERIEYLRTSSINYPTPSESIALTKIDVPLHPRYNYNWSALTKEEIIQFRTDILNEWQESKRKINNKPKLKTVLEKILIPHKIVENYIDFEEESIVLEKCLLLTKPYIEVKGENTLEIINNIAGFKILEKAPVFVGARMGRPEKAK
ncbi:DNA polymerase II large subunit, partial [Candidatus Bathyarchaeota archaeon]|nr:DNA polymerase II large subunit [Candidatus Bathyarchaeota archaeon]